MKLPAEVKAYLAAAGRKGGSATGPSKRRGDSEYYRQIAAKRKRKEKQDVSKPQGD